MLAGRQPFGGFEVVSAVLFLSFGISCLLDWLGQPFFICHQHLWFGLSFFATSICGLIFLCFATGICVQSLSFTAFSAISIRVRFFWYYAVRLWLLVSFILGVTLWKALQIPLWSKPHLVFCHRVYEITLSEVFTIQIGVTETQHQSQLAWIDVLQKSRGLHSVSAYRHGLYIYEPVPKGAPQGPSIFWL